MLKVKTSFGVMLALVFMAGLSAPAFAAENKSDEMANRSRAIAENGRGEDQRSATSSERLETKDNEENDQSDRSTSTPRAATSDAHRSAVSLFVQRLLQVADREPEGLGRQVRIIAREQNDSGTTTTAALTEVEQRGNAQTFFFGSDYASLGIIRRELAKTDKQIERLQALVAETTDVQTKAEITAQIQRLQEDQVRLTHFINQFENRFSLFGWFVKWFSK